jgi:integrase/recombinase XerD
MADDAPGQDLRITPVPLPVPFTVAPAQAATDAELIALWLHGRPPATQRAYQADAAAFLTQVEKPLGAVTLGDVQAFVDRLAAQAPTSRARRISAVKSLLSFAHQLGYVVFNVGAPIRVPAIKTRLAERILDEADVVGSRSVQRSFRFIPLARLYHARITSNVE